MTNKTLKNYIYRLMTDQEHGLLATLLKWKLLGLSYVFQFAIFMRSVFFKLGLIKTTRLAKPVISVGNLVLGGSGKTPLVIYIAKYLKAKGIKPAILSRGYMAHKSEVSLENDECKMLKEILCDVPVLVGPDRVFNAKQFLSHADADVFILDDGFQHWRIHRDLDIVTIDSQNPFGNGHLFPRGILRESKSALKRADLVVLTKTKENEDHFTLVNNLKQIQSNLAIVRTRHKISSIVDLRNNEDVHSELLNGLPGIICSSIGAPASFKKTVESLGIAVRDVLIFEDHHVYAEKDIYKINEVCNEANVRIILTTHKDAVKLRKLVDLFDRKIRIFILNIEIDFLEGKDEILKRIDHILFA